MRRRQSGQAVVFIALMISALIAAIGLGVDGGIAYYWNASAERAAASAALAGVVFMPGQFSSDSAIPEGSGNDATDRAIVAAKRNGFDTADTYDAVTVTPAPIPGAGNKLQVTVSRTVRTFFMNFFGVASYTVSRTAIASYLPPIRLGQPGGQVGSTVSQLGTGNNFYFLRTEGWATDRGQGDALTPGPNTPGCGPACPSNDVHQISAYKGTDNADPSLPSQGGYNYMVTVPTGATATIQVYNAAFAPDGNVGGPNYCENWNTGGSQPRACSAGGNYYMHEDDCCSFSYGSSTGYSAMKYTIFKAPSVFIRSSDTVISQMLVKPVDASCWVGAGCSNTGYTNVNTGNFIQQKYDPVTGAPQNMTAYHAWMNIGGYIPDNTCAGPCGGGNEAESNLITYTPGKGPIGAVGPGTYRLRIDTLEYNGANPCSSYPGNCTGQSYAHKGLAVRVMDGTGTGNCGGCTISALVDMAIYTPISVSGGSFPVPVFQLSPDYAGQTISLDIFDAGDMSGSGAIYLGVVDPTTGSLVVEPAGGPPATVYDCFSQRTNYPASCNVIGTYANPNGVEQIVTNGGTLLADNKWYHYDIPIPSTYNPGSNPANWWWKLNYRTTGSVTATDTITITLNLRGNPAHLLQS